MNHIKTNPHTVVDLFCGAGGLSLGFQRAGFSVLKAVDAWKAAVDTYSANLGDHVSLEDISQTTKLPQATVFTGGPPCQGFSSAGRRQEDDHRNSLVSAYALLIAEHRPKAFIFENVEGFLTGCEGKFIFELLDKVIDAGYRVHLRKINAAHFGVPQHRKRVIAIGGLGWDPTFPTITHNAFGAPGAELDNRFSGPSTPTLWDAIGTLPSAVPRGLETSDEDHTYNQLAGDDLARARLLGEGQCMKDLPEELWHDSYKRRANRRVQDGTPTERRGGAPAGVRRLKSDEPSKAITGGAMRDFLHPQEDRTLTIRECALLQTFPLNYKFRGTRADRVQLIGNAVPPLLAEVIAQRILRDLIANQSIETKKGGLLSFQPTSSLGMSPLLDRITKEVKQRYLSKPTLERQLALWD
ncbi:MAG: DNA cytosine methyltransferase [Planctomycetota bacterium]|nr:DNA cytosine methyltransferase [Planctomycetota bacterium]